MNLTGQPVYAKHRKRKPRDRQPTASLPETFAELQQLARQKGTDKQYRHWISHQPSCVSGRFSEWVDGVGRCEAAHVRRTWLGSGTGKKGDYCCIPLTRSEHAAQHQHGEHDKEWYEVQAAKYLRRWLAS
ncbi:hypothetical protein [Limnoglobus roseus]|uniref:Uncharacterized protein n=1 Tax=Limnoglobus roseus TaxID=2598579 RepID=A0A5C1A9Q9_9BACT|nr:hypothetical protein [Limnoglobus roseus]QEL14766.1 hypothetical protein PX52LOC_01660 [Limnoglobus roseus]